ncbi:lactoylglutathione lyase [Pseudomonas sp.]|uniref:lactoylglutathione lyase n=1 Tax=Pseudomonas sp. TaxID=306 RepID=UPI00262129D5|nr:lactoylglutathione lyase [Pseudomonas sp.]
MQARLMHTMLRVLDLPRALAFYVDLLGMRVLHSTDYPAGRFSNTFIGYDTEDQGAVLELTHNWDRLQPYVQGDAWGHVAIGVDDVHSCVQRLRAKGVVVVREPGPMAGGARLIAFVLDPDGYRIELLQSASGRVA